MADEDYERALRAELDRRIAALAAAPPTELGGELGVIDVVTVVALFVLAPVLFIWLYA